jgi:hypothetical protein
MQRTMNRRGKRSVSCMVTDRWLQFPETATTVNFGDGKPSSTVVVNVMTETGGEARKICELTIRLEDLQNAVANIKMSHEK